MLPYQKTNRFSHGERARGKLFQKIEMLFYTVKVDSLTWQTQT